jgi:hypothetical protein
VVAARKKRVSPMMIETGIVSFCPRGNMKSISPTKNKARAAWRSTGRAEKICGTRHTSRASERMWNMANFSLEETSGYDWCSRSHWSEMVPTSTVVRERIRLMNQKILIRTDDDVGENGTGTKEGGGGEVLFRLFAM